MKSLDRLKLLQKGGLVNYGSPQTIQAQRYFGTKEEEAKVDVPTNTYIKPKSKLGQALEDAYQARLKEAQSGDFTNIKNDKGILTFTHLGKSYRLGEAVKGDATSVDVEDDESKVEVKEGSLPVTGLPSKGGGDIDTKVSTGSMDLESKATGNVTSPSAADLLGLDKKGYVPVGGQSNTAGTVDTKVKVAANPSTSDEESERDKNWVSSIPGKDLKPFNVSKHSQWRREFEIYSPDRKTITVNDQALINRGVDPEWYHAYVAFLNNPRNPDGTYTRYGQQVANTDKTLKSNGVGNQDEDKGGSKTDGEDRDLTDHIYSLQKSRLPGGSNAWKDKPDILNRSDPHRDKPQDEEIIYLLDYMKSQGVPYSSVDIVDIGSGLGIEPKKGKADMPGETVAGLYDKLYKSGGDAPYIYATDYEGSYKDFKGDFAKKLTETRPNLKTALFDGYTPDFSFIRQGNEPLILKAANSVDKIFDGKEAVAHFKDVASKTVNKPVFYIYHDKIMYKASNSTSWRYLGDIENKSGLKGSGTYEHLINYKKSKKPVYDIKFNKKGGQMKSILSGYIANKQQGGALNQPDQPTPEEQEEFKEWATEMIQAGQIKQEQFTEESIPQIFNLFREMKKKGKWKRKPKPQSIMRKGGIFDKFQEGGIVKRKGDPYEYKDLGNGKVATRKSGTGKWIELSEGTAYHAVKKVLGTSQSPITRDIKPSVVLKTTEPKKIAVKIESTLTTDKEPISYLPNKDVNIGELTKQVQNLYKQKGDNFDYYYLIDKPTATMYRMSLDGKVLSKDQVGLGKNIGDRDVSKGRSSDVGSNKTQSGLVRINRESSQSNENFKYNYGKRFMGFEALTPQGFKEIPTGIHGTEHKNLFGQDEASGRVSGGCTRMSDCVEDAHAPYLKKGVVIYYTSDDNNSNISLKKNGGVITPNMKAGIDNLNNIDKFKDPKFLKWLGEGKEVSQVNIGKYHDRWVKAGKPEGKGESFILDRVFKKGGQLSAYMPQGSMHRYSHKSEELVKSRYGVDVTKNGIPVLSKDCESGTCQYRQVAEIEGKEVIFDKPLVDKVMGLKSNLTAAGEAIFKALRDI